MDINNNLPTLPPSWVIPKMTLFQLVTDVDNSVPELGLLKLVDVKYLGKRYSAIAARTNESGDDCSAEVC